MSDDIKELLTLAAKACGYEVGQANGKYFFCEHGPHGPGMYCKRGNTMLNWHPHIDDGDGARMETAAQVSIYRGDDCVRCWGGGHFITEKFSDHNGDEQAARRWASLRAAAQIGRSMP